MKTMFQRFMLRMTGLALASDDPDIEIDRAQSDAIRERSDDIGLLMRSQTLQEQFESVNHWRSVRRSARNVGG